MAYGGRRCSRCDASLDGGWPLISLRLPHDGFSKNLEKEAPLFLLLFCPLFHQVATFETRLLKSQGGRFDGWVDAGEPVAVA